MIEIIWEFSVLAEWETKFERYYGSDGTWAELFARASGFHGTALLRDQRTRGRYLTVDRWQDLKSFETFKDQFIDEYQRIDRQMEKLTLSETLVGIFDLPAESQT